MAAKTNLITTTEITVNPREIDFVTRFQRNWEHLREIMGIMRPIRMQPGTVLKSKYAQGTLQSGTVAEGEEIPYSQYTVKEKDYGKITIEKYAKAVSLEAIQNYGYDVAVQKTDDEFLFDLTAKVTDKFYKYLNTGSLKGTPKTFQMALAMAKGSVENKFKNMHRTVTGVVGFANVLTWRSTWAPPRSPSRTSTASSTSRISWVTTPSSCCLTARSQRARSSPPPWTTS